MVNDSTARFKGAQHRDLHQHNLSLVLYTLRNRPASRTTLARRTGLTPTTIGRLATTLIDLGLLTATDLPAGHKRGRPATSLSLSSSMVSYGVEVTADDITIVQLTLAGESSVLQRIRVPHALSPAALADTIAATINDASADAARQGRRVFGLGLAVPALVRFADQVIGVSASLGWREVRLTQEVRDRLSLPIPVMLDSRAKCHALAQSDQISGAAQKTLVHLEVDFTVGAGIIVNGMPQVGSRGYGGNVGHIPLDPRGPQCQCGNAGCLEALAGLRRVIELARLDVAEADATTHASTPPRDVLVDLLAANAEAGDARTLDALRVAGHWLGVGCVSVLHTLDPDAISIGGYPAALERWVLPHVRQAIKDLAQYDYAAAHDLLLAPDRSAIARGAATMCVHSLLADPLSASSHDRESVEPA